MSGLYNMIFNVSPLAGSLLAIINVDHKVVARFRDCFLNSTGSEIVIYTRTGGGNRSEYEVENAKLRQVAGFIGDEDDSFDSTYALFRYKIPEDYQASCKELADAGFGIDPAKRWEEALRAMGKTK